MSGGSKARLAGTRFQKIVLEQEKPAFDSEMTPNIFLITLGFSLGFAPDIFGGSREYVVSQEESPEVAKEGGMALPAKT